MANVLIIEKVAENLFIHRLNDLQEVMDNNPNLTSIKDIPDNSSFLNFKTKNGAPIIKQQRIEPQEITIIDTFGGTGTFTGFTNPLGVYLKLSELGYFIPFGNSGSGSGVNRFKDLLDVFPQGTYSGQNGKVYVVNESQQRIDATTFYNKRLFSELEDVATGALNTSMAGKILQISLVSGVARVTLANMPGFSDSLKQTYKIRFSSDDTPDLDAVVAALNSYTTTPFDSGLVPNDMGGILVEVYDSMTDETVRVYELTGVSAGSALSEVGETNVQLLTQATGVPDIDTVLATGDTAIDKKIVLESASIPSKSTINNGGIAVTNTSTNVTTSYQSEGMIHAEGGFSSTDNFEAQTQNNTRVIPNKSGTYSMLSDILTRALTGLSLVTGGVISATDTILQALGKLQNQITNIKTVNNNSLQGPGNVKTSFEIVCDTTARSYTGAGTYTVGTYTIPANTIPANCVLRTMVRFYKTGGNLAFSTSLVSTSMPQSRLINNVNSGAITNTFMEIIRNSAVGGNKIRGFDTSGSTYHTFAANNAVYANVDFDVTISQTFNLTMTTSSATDTIIFDYLAIEILNI